LRRGHFTFRTFLRVLSSLEETPMRFVKVLSCLLLASGLAAAASAGPTLVTVHGLVEIGSGTPPVWRAAASGDALAPGDAVRTGVGARAELALGDARTVRVYEQSVLRVGTSVTPTGAVRSVDLDQGHSIFDVMKKAVADEFDVITPEVVVSVKGTRFLVAAVEGQDYTSVFRGVVELAGPGFETVAVRPGLTGAEGELSLTPFADPWEAWATGAPVPEPLLEQKQEREVNDALRAAVASTEAGATEEPGLLAALGGLLGFDDAAGDANAGADSDTAAAATAAEPVGSLVEGTGELVTALTEPLAGATEPLLGATGEAAGELLAPVTDPVGGLLAPVTDPVGGLLAPVTDPLTAPVGGLLGGLLGGGSP
jgi:hypothetical protein